MPKQFQQNDGRRAPKGHFIVYVGEELRRFIVPLSYLKNPTFSQLLDKLLKSMVLIVVYY
ncbi:hypothetical protein Patl1_18175 [Pistacia atlantica]|uniref:Uncharacterized protein n=1 Tax=Pistacia atlantica TaxID=434234 RepID=A0ACC1C261_9ROSI|nr:hypothetical protein Patl1_18175 [Pistacia atlantica]